MCPEMWERDAQEARARVPDRFTPYRLGEGEQLSPDITLPRFTWTYEPLSSRPANALYDRLRTEAYPDRDHGADTLGAAERVRAHWTTGPEQAEWHQQVHKYHFQYPDDAPPRDAEPTMAQCDGAFDCPKHYPTVYGGEHRRDVPTDSRTSARHRAHWTTGPGSQPIRWPPAPRHRRPVNPVWDDEESQAHCTAGESSAPCPRCHTLFYRGRHRG